MGKFLNTAATPRTLLFHYVTVLFHTHISYIWFGRRKKKWLSESTVRPLLEDTEENHDKSQKVEPVGKHASIQTEVFWNKVHVRNKQIITYVTGLSVHRYTT
jgi:hypothetical protein